MTESQQDKPVHELPDNPRARPAETLDALEEKVLGATVEPGRDEDDTDEAAFEQDVEPDEVSADDGGHPAEEPSG